VGVSSSSWARVRRLLSGLGVRWRTFARDADALRAASSTISAVIRSRGASDGRPLAGLPRLSLPVAGRITSRYGIRHGRLHEGIDIAQPLGAPVHPVLAGVVLLADSLPVYGGVVVVDHGCDLATVYAHLAEIGVGVEQRVERGDVVGTVGVSGRSFGPHVHFEVRLEGTAVDPLVFLT
jgi:murein DD-endopeptidase MepM/ murein hydrolase activator NlpD